MKFTDTIFALSSGALPAGVAVVRLSGPRVRFVCGMILKKSPEPRRAAVAAIRDADGGIVDRALVLHFEGPNSFTGEDMLELHLHGGRAVVARVLAMLGRLPGLRAAEPGEFTRRAFGNGKMDLTQAEAFADLVAAETEAQRRLAMLNSEGGQAELYRTWRARLLHARAMLEAELDFADEGDVPGSVSEQIWQDMRQLAFDISEHLRGYERAEMIRDGLDVVIVGAPNAGKSSLLNALARREAAIVSEHAGTTRDLIEVALDLEGYKVRVTDTAGLRDAGDAVERIGVARAAQRAQQAHLVLALTDIGSPRPIDLVLSGSRVIRVGTKADLGAGVDLDIAISTLTGVGLGSLLSMIVAVAAELAGGVGDLIPSRQRHVANLQQTHAALQRALSDTGRGLELRAEELREAGNCLGRITGDIDVEDLLGAIFANFCIGK